MPPLAGGLYTLISIDGAALRTSAEPRFTESGTLTLADQGVFQLFVVRATAPGAAGAAITFSGHWTQRDAAITLAEDGFTGTGTYTAQLTANGERLKLPYDYDHDGTPEIYEFQLALR